MPNNLHSAWCKASGQQLHERLTERIFFEAEKMGITADDVRCVVEFLTRFNKRSDGAKFRINAFKVIGDLETFAATLAEARAVERNRRPAPTEKEKVVEAFRPTVDPEQVSTLSLGAGRHVSELFRKMS
jgi:hypothetical protein